MPKVYACSLTDILAVQKVFFFLLELFQKGVFITCLFVLHVRIHKLSVMQFKILHL